MVDIHSETLRLGEESKKKEKEDRRNHRAKILWPALFHGAATIKFKIGSE